MARKKPQKMFGATNVNDADPWVSAWTISMTARNVRNEIGKAWKPENPAEGWKSARIDGMRVVKVEVQIVR